jgi:biotin operon repressor
MKTQAIERLQAKTSQHRFVQLLEKEFQFAPKVAKAVLDEAHVNLLGGANHLKPGQMHIVLVKRSAAHGRRLRDTDLVDVTWTIDAGDEDLLILQEHGMASLRRSRIQRLLTEALEQGAAATQEDLARVLHTSVRTIKRDCAHLKEQGMTLPTRGYVRGIGRGQTHKAQIITRWLRGETYDKIALHTHHSLASIQRYIRAFVQVIQLQRQGFSVEEVAMLAQISLYLVREYLLVYEENDTPTCRGRLEEQLERLNRRFQPDTRQKKGGA